MRIIRYAYRPFKSVMALLKANQIETYIHIDLIKGMAVDDTCEYIIQTYKPKGIVSYQI